MPLTVSALWRALTVDDDDCSCDGGGREWALSPQIRICPNETEPHDPDNPAVEVVYTSHGEQMVQLRLDRDGDPYNLLTSPAWKCRKTKAWQDKINQTLARLGLIPGAA